MKDAVEKDGLNDGVTPALQIICLVGLNTRRLGEACSTCKLAQIVSPLAHIQKYTNRQ